MSNQTEMTKSNFSMRDFLGGVIVGGLAGAATAYLTAPQAGKKTRAQLHKKTMQLRNKAPYRRPGSKVAAASDRKGPPVLWPVRPISGRPCDQRLKFAATGPAQLFEVPLNPY